MARTKRPTSQLLAAINSAPRPMSVAVPLPLLANPGLSATAKSIMSIALAEDLGWPNLLEVLQCWMGEGRDAIARGLKELEDAGYLARVRYCSDETKRVKGSLWLYTTEPWRYSLSQARRQVARIDCSLYTHDIARIRQTRSSLADSNKNDISVDRLDPDPRKPGLGRVLRARTCVGAFLTPTRSSTYVLHTRGACALCAHTRTRTCGGDEPPAPAPKNTAKPLKKKPDKGTFISPLSIAQAVSRVVQGITDVRVPSGKLHQWSHAIGKLHKPGGVSFKRMYAALVWYQENHDQEYVPQIHNGFHFVDKFTQLERAMRNSTKKSSVGVHTPDPDDKYASKCRGAERVR